MRTAAPCAVLLAALGACGGGGTDPDAVGGGPEATGIAALAGLYDLTVTIDGETDVGYVELRADSTLVRHDYQQDDVGSGANCWIRTGPVRVMALGADRYAVDLPGDPQELTLARGAGGGLYIAEERFDTVNGFAQTITVAEEYPLVTGVSPEDLSPCA